MLYGVRLQVKGKSQSDKVEELMKVLPNPGRKQRCTFDRGYGEMDFVGLMVKLGFEIATFALSRSIHSKIEAEICRKR
jgi:hypothetical protein